MEPTIRPWYKKKRYAIPLGALGVFTLVGATGGSTSPKPAAPILVIPVEQASTTEAAIEVEEASAAASSTPREAKAEVKTAPKRTPTSQPEPVYTSPSCCKYCSAGKACGDSCISRSYTCHKGPGCACDS